MSEYTQIASTADLQPGHGKCFDVGGTQVGLFNVDGVFYAINNVCPHAMGPLAEGDLEDKVISCPVHGWNFDVTTGECAFMPGVSVKTYPCKVEGDQVLVQVAAE